jgi:hypothetical protein
VQEAAIRINRRRIQTLHRDKRKLLNSSRPELLQGKDQESMGEDETLQMDNEIKAAIEHDKRIINAIQQ